MSDSGTTARAIVRSLERDLHLDDIDALSAEEQRAMANILDHWRELLDLRLEKEARYA